MDVLIDNPFKNKTKENADLAQFTVYPEKVPYKNITVFFSKQEDRVTATWKICYQYVGDKKMKKNNR